jgi:uncharacterized membrane protein HdeD (DUF308 family)
MELTDQQLTDGLTLIVYLASIVGIMAIAAGISDLIEYFSKRK